MWFIVWWGISPELSIEEGALYHCLLFVSECVLFIISSKCKLSLKDVDY